MRRAAVAVLLLMCVLLPAFSAPVPPAGAPMPDVSGVEPGARVSAHGWLVLPTDPGRAQLVHLPPRGPGGAASGLARLARELATQPDAVAWWGGHVAVVYQGDGAGTRVATLRAVHVGEAGWAYEPAGRLESLAPPPAGRVRGAVGEADGLALLIDRDGVLHIARWRDGAWTTEEVVSEGGERPSNTESFLIGWGGRSAVVEDQSKTEAARLWVEEGGAWAVRSLGDRVLRGDVMHGLPGGSGAMIVVQRRPESQGELDVWRVEAGEAWRLARIGGVPEEHQSAVLGADGASPARLVLTWKRPNAAREVVELSLATGLVLYRGEPVRTAALGAGLYRLVVAVLLVGMVGVLVMVVAIPEGRQAVVLPPMCALAEPGRRLSASLVDLALVTLVGSAVFGTPMLSIVTGMALVDPSANWLAVPGTILFGLTLGTLGDWLLGGSPGKLLAGCRVVRVGSALQRVSLGRCILRNGVKWLLPPVAAMALVEQEGRHRGDVLAKAIVVVPAEPAED